MVSNDTNQEQFDSYNGYIHCISKSQQPNTIIKLKNQFDIDKTKIKGKDTEQYNKNRDCKRNQSQIYRI